MLRLVLILMPAVASALSSTAVHVLEAHGAPVGDWMGKTWEHNITCPGKGGDRSKHLPGNQHWFARQVTAVPASLAQVMATTASVASLHPAMANPGLQVTTHQVSLVQSS
jgi:hypothetical protein